MTTPAFPLIYLGGPSSSGKSTLARALQDALPDPYLHVSIDSLIRMMPARLNGWERDRAVEGFSWHQSKDRDGMPLRTLQLGPFARSLRRSFHEVCMALAKSQQLLIIDDVPLTQTDLDAFQKALHAFPVLWVSVSAPLDILEKRERNRGDRSLGSARVQWKAHAEQTGYTLQLDTAALSIEEQVHRIHSQIYEE
jgi:chloramphenicol 3-O phosphotransferase